MTWRNCWQFGPGIHQAWLNRCANSLVLWDIIAGFAELSEPVVALTRKETVFTWTSERQDAFEVLKSCLLQAPILGFPTEANRFVLDTDASLFTLGGVLNEIQGDWEVVIAYASWSLRQSQRRYCTTRREMLAAVTMCTHFRSYLRGAQFTLRTDHRSLRWLQKFCNSDGMLAHYASRPVLVSAVSICDRIVRWGHRTLVLWRLCLPWNWRTNLSPSR